jgi:two-component system, NtrC family, sensor kinase
LLHPLCLATLAHSVDDLPILFVDDEAEVLRALARTAEKEGWKVVTATRPSEGIAKLEQSEYAVVVSDFRMPEMDGIAFLTLVRDRWPGIERVLVTAYADTDALERGINDAAIGRYMRKPWRREALISVIDQAMGASRMRRERDVLLERVKNRNEELVYVNELLRADAAQSEKVAFGIRRRWDVALNAISDPLLIVSSDLRVEVANDAAANIAGSRPDEMEGRKCHEVLFGSETPCTGCPIGMGSGRVMRRGGGREQSFDARAYSLPGPATLCVYRDITRELAFQQEAVHVEKMAAIGRLAGGVAHEINNPLHGILSFVQLAQKPDVPADKLKRYHDVIKECALRCRDIVQSLRDFSRRASTEKREVDLDEVCDKALVLFQQLEGRLEVKRGDGKARCYGNANQLQQIVVNLVQNAADATGASEGPIRVSVYLDGDQAVTAVDDAGSGVPIEERERIFEPFYTTKPEGVGTGLGLAISHTLTTEHGGVLRVLESDLGGARFELRLPRFVPEKKKGEG